MQVKSVFSCRKENNSVCVCRKKISPRDYSIQGPEVLVETAPYALTFREHPPWIVGMRLVHISGDGKIAFISLLFKVRSHNKKIERILAAAQSLEMSNSAWYGGV